MNTLMSRDACCRPVGQQPGRATTHHHRPPRRPICPSREAILMDDPQDRFTRHDRARHPAAIGEPPAQRKSLRLGPISRQRFSAEA